MIFYFILFKMKKIEIQINPAIETVDLVIVKLSKFIVVVRVCFILYVSELFILFFGNFYYVNVVKVDSFSGPNLTVSIIICIYSALMAILNIYLTVYFYNMGANFVRMLQYGQKKSLWAFRIMFSLVALVFFTQ